ncbi:MAG: beta strand repeat-containing protein [bacterium]
MAELNDINKNALSFKKVFGKVHTNEGFSINNEKYGTNISIASSTIFGENINPTPITSGLTSLYDNDGIVELVRFIVEEIPDTEFEGDTQGFRLKLPLDYSANGALNSEYSSGQILYETLGKLQIVPTLYGTFDEINATTEYDYKVYDSSLVQIPAVDIGWILDPYSGVLFVQDPNPNTQAPAFVEAFLYIGDYVSDQISTVSGATNINFTNLGGGIGILSGVTDTNPKDAFFRTISAGTNINISNVGDLLSFENTISGNSGVSLAGNLIQLDLSNYTAPSSINITTQGGDDINVNLDGSFIITDNRSPIGSKSGVQYAANYHAGYDSRSLVDKEYVDLAIEIAQQGLSPKEAVLAATTSTGGTVDLSGGTFNNNGNKFDGIILSDGNRVLVKNQSDAFQNGIYYLTGSTFERTEDADGVNEIIAGTFVFVLEGLTQKETGWVQINTGITIDASEIEFTLFNKVTDVIFNNLGNGAEVFKEKNGQNAYFRTLNNNDGSIDIIQTSDEIIISAGTGSLTGITTTGSGFSLVGPKIDKTGFVRSLSAGTNINLTSEDGNIRIDANTSDISNAVIGFPRETGDTDSSGNWTNSNSDGLLAFTTGTPIGYAIDDINEVLRLLAPIAPDLDDIESSNATEVILSFGTSKSIAGYTNVSSDAGSGSVDINETYSSSSQVSPNRRLGAFGSITNLTGVLNDDVSQSEYSANSFGNAYIGTLNLFVNGSLIDTLNLSATTASTNSTNGWMSVSSISNTKFANRTGTYSIPVGQFTNGFNYIRIIHDKISSSATTNFVEFVYDPDGNSLAFDGTPSIYDISMSGSKFVSGVEYHTNGNVTYSATTSNVYRDTYGSGNVISYPSRVKLADASLIIKSGSEVVGETGSTKTLPSLTTNAGSELTELTLTSTHVINASTVLGSATTTGQISTNIQITHPLKSNLNGGTANRTGFLMYNVTQSSNPTSENFTGEVDRIENIDYSNPSVASYSDVDGGTYDWDSTENLISGTAGYDDGLLVFNGDLLYPNSSYLFTNYGIPADGNFNLVQNGPSGNANYTSASGERIYTRKFQKTNAGTSSSLEFDITHTGSNSDFDTTPNTGATPSGNNIAVEIAIVRSNGTSYGWYNIASTGNNDGVARVGSITQSGNVSTINVTLGTDPPRIGQNDYLILRVRTSSSYSNRISQISVTFN